MPRFVILPVAAIILPLIGCVAQPSPSGQSSSVPAVAGTQEPATGTRIYGVTPENPTVVVGRDQIDQTNSSNWADILNHSSAWPMLQVTH
jgi:hypothetical protein